MGLFDKLLKPQWMDEDGRKAKQAVAKYSAAARRLSDLPCTDGGYHEWVTIYEEDNSALGAYSEGPRTTDWEKRCSKCGLELTNRTRVGNW